MIRRVVGNSMRPGLAPGDILIISKRYKPKIGDIVIAKKNGREVVKRVTRIAAKNRYYLEGDNKKASTDSRSYGSVSRRQIVGVAVWAIGLSRFHKGRSHKKRTHRRRLVALAGMLIIIVAVGACIVWAGQISANKQPLIKKDYVATLPKTAVMVPKYEVGTVKHDVPYCNGQNLDIYYPRKGVYETAPVVMYLHGGGWKINDKTSEPNQLAVIDGLRDEGFAMVSIDYRKLPESYFPAPVSDALCAVRFMRANSASIGLNGERVGIYGFSAGGHLAAMVGTLDSQNQFNEGPFKEFSSRVKAVTTLAGIFDFEKGLRPGYDAKIQYFLNGSVTADAQPISYVSADDPPFMLVHGLQDQYIDPQQDELFAQRLNEVGVKNQIIDVQNAEHGLGAVGGELSPTKQKVDESIRNFLKDQLLKN